MGDLVNIIVILLVGAGVVWYLARWFERQRTEEYAAVARKLGLQFWPGEDPALLASLGRFSLFQQGHSRKLKNIIRGQTQNVDVAIFNYRYTIGGGNSSSRYRQTVIRFDSPWLALPRFELRPAHMGHRLAKLFGYRDISIPEFPAFSKKYLLRGDDEEAIRVAFHDELVLYLQKLDGLHLAGDRSQLVAFRPNKILRGYELRGFLDEAFGIYSHFKSPNSSEVH